MNFRCLKKHLTVINSNHNVIFSLFTAIVAYTFFGLDQLAKEIQEPFQDRPMCLALSAMARVIEIDTMEALGQDPPQFLTPKFTILM